MKKNCGSERRDRASAFFSEIAGSSCVETGPRHDRTAILSKVRGCPGLDRGDRKDSIVANLEIDRSTREPSPATAGEKKAIG